MHTVCPFVRLFVRSFVCALFWHTFSPNNKPFRHRFTCGKVQVGQQRYLFRVTMLLPSLCVAGRQPMPSRLHRAFPSMLPALALLSSRCCCCELSLYFLSCFMRFSCQVFVPACCVCGYDPHYQPIAYISANTPSSLKKERPGGGGVCARRYGWVVGGGFRAGWYFI